MRLLALSLCVTGLFASAASAQLLIPDSGADRIMMFSHVDGSLIDANWITNSGGGWNFITPKEAIQVGNQIWISDQVADAVYRFDFNRNYLGSITAHASGSGNLDNLRGMGWDGNHVYVTTFHSTTALRGMAVYDMAGNPVSFFQNGGSFFDAVPMASGELLVSNSTGGVVQRYLPDGTLLGNFASGFSTPQQVALNDDGSILVVGSLGTAAQRGVYHYDADGSLIRFIATQPALGTTAIRGAHILENGEYLIAAGNGVYTYDYLTDAFTTVLAGVDAQYINYIAIPAPATLPLLMMGVMVRRRRRS
jgi:hypothetical protein